MSIEFIGGKPGNGKSLLAVMQLVEMLRSRPEVYFSTNLPLNMPRLCEFLHEKYKDTFRAVERIRLLDDKECSEFWLYPYPGFDLDPEKRVQIVSRAVAGKKHTKDVIEIAEQRRNAPQKGAGVVYIIDEAHQYFGARDWAVTGSDCLHYLSQHRKLGDDVFPITQSIENVDTQFRRVAQAFHYVKNLRKMSLPIVGGIFKAPPLFIQSTYLSPQTGKEICQKTRTFTLDAKGIASCYETAAGVGIVGNFADKGNDQKGLPWWIVPIGIAVLGVSVIKVPGWAFKKVLGVGQRRDGVAGVLPATNQLHSVTRRPELKSSSEGVKAVEFSAPLPFVESEEISWTGRVKVNGRWIFGLSDGRVFKTPDARIRAVGRDAIQIGTNVYLWGQPRPKQKVTPPVQIVSSGGVMAAKPKVGWQD